MHTEILSRLPPDEVEALLAAGQLNDQDVLEYTGLHHLKTGGHFLDLDVEQVDTLFNRGHLSEYQTGQWIDYQESPGLFYAKDIGYGALRGTIEAVNEVGQKVNSFFSWLFDVPEEERELVPLTDLVMPEEPSTFGGQFVSGVTQFGTAFIPAFGWANVALKAPKLMTLAKISPRIARFLAGQIASLTATATVIDPWEDRLSNLIAKQIPDDDTAPVMGDWLAEAPVAPLVDSIANFLKAEPDDSAAEAIAKSVIEDQILGTFAEGGVELVRGLFHGLKSLRGQLLLKHAGDAPAVATEIDEVVTKIVEQQDLVDSAFHPVNKTWDLPTGKPIEGVSKMTHPVKRQVNKPERWLYITEVAPEAPGIVPPPGMAAELLGDHHLVDGESLGLLKHRILQGNHGMEKELSESLANQILTKGPEQGYLDFQDWVNPLKVTSRIAKEMAEQEGSTLTAIRKKFLQPFMEYQKYYDSVLASYRENPEEFLSRWGVTEPKVVPKQYVGYVASDQGQLVQIAKGATEEEVSRRMNMVKTNRATAELYTKPLEKEGYTFENFKKAVAGDQTIVDIMSDTNVYRVEPTKLMPGEMTPRVQTAKLKPPLKVEPAAPVDKASLKRAQEAHGIPISEAPQIPKNSDEALEAFQQSFKQTVGSLEITDKELPEITATVFQLAKGMLDVEHIADYELLMKEGYPIAGLTARQSREFSGVNLKRFLAPENSQQIITHIYRTLKDRIQEAGGGAVVHMEDTNEEALMRLSGWTGVGKAWKSLKALEAATEDLPVAIRAAEIYFSAYAEMLTKFAEKAVSTEDKLLVQEMTHTFAEVFNILHGAKANIGRAMNIQRMMKGGDRFGFHLLDPDTVLDIHNHAGKNLDELVEQLKALGKQPRDRGKAVAQFVRRYHGIRWIDSLIEIKLSSMLSSPTTWAKNLVGTTARMVHEEFNMDTALMLQGLQNQDIELFKEVWRRWTTQGHAMLDALGAARSWRGFAEALKDGKGLGEATLKGWRGFADAPFWQSLKSGDSVLDPVAKWEFGEMTPNLGKWLPVGDVIRIPFHVLTATDEVMQSVSYMGAMRYNAIQEGIERGLRGNELVRFATELIDNPSHEFHRRAIHDSRWMTFKQNLEGKQKSFHDWLLDTRQSHPASKVIFPLLRGLFIPFDKVLFNILNSVGDTMPIFTKKFRADWAAGGIRRKTAVLRVATGMAMFYAGAQLYYNGKLRGVTDFKERATAQALHIPDNAWFNAKTGEWETLTGLDPVAMYFTIGANIAHLYDVVGHMDEDADNKVKQAVAKGLATLSEAVAYAPGMEGAHDLLRIIFDPGGANKLGRMAVTQAGTFMPFSALQKYVANLTQDPEYRELGSMFDDWKNVMNGLWNQHWNREGMLPRRHVLFGDRTEKFEGYTFWGGQRKEMMMDPSLLELADTHTNVERMSPRVTHQGVTIELTPEQMDEAQEYMTQLEVIPGIKGLRNTLNYLVTTPQYQQLKRPEDRGKELRKVITKFRTASRRMVLQKTPALQQKIIEQTQKRMAQQLGIMSIPEDYGTLTHNIREYLTGLSEQDTEE